MAALSPGSRLGPYEIQSALGAGGMGEVYAALDTRLGRRVALKVSQQRFGDRFEQEARAIAALNHPHICTLYDVGPDYLVMELVEGESLRDLLQRGPLPIREALRFAREIAGALVAADTHGIVHRDLKPANVMVTSSGAKVLDFGLAKRFEPAPPEAETLSSPPREAMTQPGQVMGTVAYMSPEQAEGRSIDARSDIFSLGVVLYEMLCGRRPFRGDTTLAVLACTLHATPERPTLLRPDIPQELERVVLRCLQKRPEDRFGSAAELGRALDAFEAPARTSAIPVPRGVLVAAALLAMLAAGFLAFRSWQVRSRARWVEEIAAPEIARLIQADRGLAALALFREAERYAPASKSLYKLADGVAPRPVRIETTPPGARVYVSDYTAAAGDDLSEWRLLGEAPLDAREIPTWGYYRARATKAGFVPADVVFGGEPVVRLELRPEATAPAGMVWVPAATAPGGLALPGFWIDRYEVTHQQYKRFVDDGGYQKPEYWRQPFVRDGRTLSFQQAVAEFRDLAGRPGPAGWQLGAYPDGRGDEPVTGVSWYEAVAYSHFVGKALPTVHEWRQAAPPALNSNILALSNYGGAAPARAGTYRGISRYGAYDMAGNAKEWAWNAADDRRYTLGGAWNEASYTYDNADPQPPFARDAAIGFRCALRVDPAPAASLAVLTPNPAPAPRGEPVSEETYRAYLGMHAYEPSKLDVRLERSDESSPFHRRETVSFRAAYGDERVLAHLFLPRNAAPPYQVVAMMGGVTIISPIRRIEDFDYPFEFIVRSGRAVVIPAFSGTLERAPSQAVRLPAHQVRERSIRWSMDLGRTLDYLETRSDVDVAKVAFYGVSMGASEGVRLTAVDSRLKAAVLSSGGITRAASPEVDSWNFAPRVRVPVLMVNGRHDSIFPLETNQKPLFQALGTKQKQHLLYDGGHRNLITRPDLLGEILNFLDRNLGPVETAR